jgi:hypothetical protein
MRRRRVEDAVWAIVWTSSAGGAAAAALEIKGSSTRRLSRSRVSSSDKLGVMMLNDTSISSDSLRIKHCESATPPSSPMLFSPSTRSRSVFDTLAAEARCEAPRLPTSLPYSEIFCNDAFFRMSSAIFCAAASSTLQLWNDRHVSARHASSDLTMAETPALCRQKRNLRDVMKSLPWRSLQMLLISEIKYH